MKALQRKILILVVSSVLISALFIMTIAFFNYGRIVESDSREIMQLMCSEKRQKIDEKLLNIKPIIIEQGEPVEERVDTINNFWSDGVLKPYSNVQFGEGGAGTFSDGKLNFIPKLGKSDLFKYMSQSEAYELIDDTEKIFNKFRRRE